MKYLSIDNLSPIEQSAISLVYQFWKRRAGVSFTTAELLADTKISKTHEISDLVASWSDRNHDVVVLDEVIFRRTRDRWECEIYRRRTASCTA